MSDIILSLRGLKQYFPVRAGFFRSVVAHVKAVDDLSLDVKRGSVHALVGESGSGKSTAARSALRLLKPTAGEILFDGEHLEHLDRKDLLPYRTKMQMIFQDPYASLNPRHTIEQAIGEGLLFHGLAKTPSEAKEQIAEVLKRVGLSPDAMQRYPHQFSGGQQQRICIGRAISLKPELLVCDEAVSALDVSIQAQILNLLTDLKESDGLSLLFIAHDLELVREISDDVTVMYLGKVMESGPVKQVFHHPGHPYTQALLASTPKNHPEQKRDRMKLTGEIPSPIHPPSGCPFRTRCPYAKAICAKPPPVQWPSQYHTYSCIIEPNEEVNPRNR